MAEINRQFSLRLPATGKQDHLLPHLAPHGNREGHSERIIDLLNKAIAPGGAQVSTGPTFDQDAFFSRMRAELLESERRQEAMMRRLLAGLNVQASAVAPTVTQAFDGSTVEEA